MLAHGLTAKLAPKPEATGGYLGRRRDPILVRDGDGVWLLWERKSNHAGNTGNVTGDLCGRRIAAGRIEAPVARVEPEGRLSWWNRLYDTHPPIEQRIQALREL